MAKEPSSCYVDVPKMLCGACLTAAPLTGHPASMPPELSMGHIANSGRTFSRRSISDGILRCIQSPDGMVRSHEEQPQTTTTMGGAGESALPCAALSRSRAICTTCSADKILILIRMNAVGRYCACQHGRLACAAQQPSCLQAASGAKGSYVSAAPPWYILG